MMLPFVLLWAAIRGIHLSVKGEATPGVNTLVLLIGALPAKVLGTTGASMLLIRSWLRMNNHRLTAHHAAFFIFIFNPRRPDASVRWLIRGRCFWIDLTLV